MLEVGGSRLAVQVCSVRWPCSLQPVCQAARLPAAEAVALLQVLPDALGADAGPGDHHRRVCQCTGRRCAVQCCRGYALLPGRQQLVGIDDRAPAACYVQAAGSCISYTSQAGDQLAGIASSYGSSVAALLAGNSGVTGGAALAPGQQLSICRAAAGGPCPQLPALSLLLRPAHKPAANATGTRQPAFNLAAGTCSLVFRAASAAAPADYLQFSEVELYDSAGALIPRRARRPAAPPQRRRRAPACFACLTAALSGGHSAYLPARLPAQHPHSQGLAGGARQLGAGLCWPILAALPVR